MDMSNLLHRRVLLTLTAPLLALFLACCDIIFGLRQVPLPDLCKQLDQAPFQAPEVEPLPVKLFETTGTIAAFHGFATTVSNKPSTQGFIKVQQSVDFPSWATDATVFLNGWRLRYLKGDHHVAGLGTVIRNIKIDRGKVKWEAVGAISDDNFDDPYNWSYTYTVLIWNAANINLTVNHSDGTCEPRDHRGDFYIADNKNTTTALSVFASFIRSAQFAAVKTIAILPRGFGFLWSGGDDHHLLQLGYNLDHSETIIQQGRKYKKQLEEETPLSIASSQVGAGFVSWQTYAILKDDDRRRDYNFGEVVSALGGDELSVVQPPFAILPRDKPGLISACLESPVLAQPQEFVVENLPYRYAIPMLTGWELAYDCRGDQHVSEIGIWIDEIQYDPNAPGTLRYMLSSVLRDKDASPTFTSNHEVTILGLRPVGPRTPATGAQPTRRQR